MRHLGFITLLSDDPASLTVEHRDLLGRVRPLVARALDRLPSLAAFGRLAGDALGAAAATGHDRCLPVPGLPRHPLLVPGSPVLTVARAHAGSPGRAPRSSAPRLAVWSGSPCSTAATSRSITCPPSSWCDRPRTRGGCDRWSCGSWVPSWRAGTMSGSAPATAFPGTPRAYELAHRLGFDTVHALLLGVAREGRYVPPALWP